MPPCGKGGNDIISSGKGESRDNQFSTLEKTDLHWSVLDTAVIAKVLANKHESLVFYSL